MYSPADRAPGPIPPTSVGGAITCARRAGRSSSPRLLADPVFHGRGVPRGDGRPVVLMPGFGGGDQTLSCSPRGSGGSATGRTPADSHEHRLLGPRHRPRRTPGATAPRPPRAPGGADRPQPGRALRPRARPPPPGARLARDLGSAPGCGRCSRPVTRRRKRSLPRAARSVRSGRARSPRCLTEACDCRFAADFAGPFPSDRVRLTSIYSKGDGVVRWQSALVPYGTCVEVTGSHVGLVFNRKTYRAIAIALADPELTPQLTGGSRC